MTVNNASSTITYQGNGADDTFTVPFPMVGPEFIQVFLTDSTGAIFHLPSAAYIVTMDPLIGANPTSQGGTIEYPLSGPPIPVGTKITIVRDLPNIQKYSISNQSIIYPTIVEEEFDYLTLLRGGAQNDFDRAFKVPPGDPLPHDVPPVSQRAGFAAFFDPIGDLVPGAIPGGGDVFISAAMIPVVEAGTLEEARDAMGISTTPLTVSGTYVVTTLNDRQVLDLEGGFYPITIPPAVNFKPQFWVFMYNRSDRGKLISVDGYPSFILWPRQFCWVFNSASGWLTTNPGRWRALLPQQFYVNNTLGNDSSDGLAIGNQAFKTIQKAVSVVETLVDGDFTINLSDGVHQVGAGVRCNKPVSGAGGYKIVGNQGTATNCNINATGGAVCFTATDNATVEISGVYLNSTSGAGFMAQNGGVITLHHVTFGEMRPSGYHMCAQLNGVINVTGEYDLRGGAAQHLLAVSGGAINYNPQFCTFTQVVTFESAFIVAQAGNIFSETDNNFGNISSCFGQEYSVLYNAVLNLRPLPRYPGTTPGSTAFGGIVV